MIKHHYTTEIITHRTSPSHITSPTLQLKKTPQNIFWTSLILVISSSLFIILNKTSRISLEPQLQPPFSLDGTYLILVQNPTKLTSHGGSIDALAYLTLSAGHLTSSRVFSLASFSNSAQISEANTNTDFPSSAKEISKLFSKSTSLSVDKVVSLNLSTISKIQNDQKSVSDYLDLLVKTGSGNQFLLSLVSDLVSQISQFSTTERASLLRLLTSELNSRQMYIFPSTPNWDGSLSPPSCPHSLCLSDFLIPVENHYGPTHASVYLLRSATVFQRFSTEQIDTEYRLTLTHAGTSSAWPSGTVKNSFQLFLPRSVTIDSVQIDDSPVTAEAYSFASQFGMSRLSLDMNIDPRKKRTLLVRYHLPVSSSTSRYRFTYRPQPGLFNHAFAETLIFPPSWAIGTHQIPAVARTGQLQYNDRTGNPYILDLNISQ